MPSCREKGPVCVWGTPPVDALSWHQPPASSLPASRFSSPRCLPTCFHTTCLRVIDQLSPSITAALPRRAKLFQCLSSVTPLPHPSYSRPSLSHWALFCGGNRVIYCHSESWQSETSLHIKKCSSRWKKHLKRHTEQDIGKIYIMRWYSTRIWDSRKSEMEHNKFAGCKDFFL